MRLTGFTNTPNNKLFARTAIQQHSLGSQNFHSTQMGVTGGVVTRKSAKVDTDSKGRRAFIVGSSEVDGDCFVS
jgi:hypothetical protein